MFRGNTPDRRRDTLTSVVRLKDKNDLMIQSQRKSTTSSVFNFSGTTPRMSDDESSNPFKNRFNQIQMRGRGLQSISVKKSLAKMEQSLGKANLSRVALSQINKSKENSVVRVSKTSA